MLAFQSECAFIPFIIFQIFFKGVRALQESKKYVLRTVNLNVNNARKDILENLKDHEILLERDWAMKFIPMQYRELVKLVWEKEVELAYYRWNQKQWM